MLNHLKNHQEWAQMYSNSTRRCLRTWDLHLICVLSVPHAALSRWPPRPLQVVSVLQKSPAVCWSFLAICFVLATCKALSVFEIKCEGSLTSSWKMCIMINICLGFNFFLHQNNHLLTLFPWTFGNPLIKVCETRLACLPIRFSPGRGDACAWGDSLQWLRESPQAVSLLVFGHHWPLDALCVPNPFFTHGKRGSSRFA